MNLNVLFSDGLSYNLAFCHSTIENIFENIPDAIELRARLLAVGKGDSSASVYARIQLDGDAPNVFKTCDATVTLDFMSGPSKEVIRCSILFTTQKSKRTLFIYPVQEYLFPEGLHVSTSELIQKCSHDLAIKLFQSQIRMGLDKGWRHLPEGAQHVEGKTFLDERSLNEALLNHLNKGDILDSIAYLMFMHDLGVNLNLSGDK